MMMGRRRNGSNDSMDSDLEDLIGKNGVRIAGEDGGANSASAKLNLDHLVAPKQKVAPGRPKTNRKFLFGRRMSCSEHCSSYLSFLCYFYPKACGCFVIFVLLTIMLLLASLIVNPVSQEYGVIQHDHSNIQSKYDLSMGEIDHWCLGGGDDNCRCEDPLVPISRNEFKSWILALKANRQMVKRFEDPVAMQNLDVAFLGESIIEEIDGRWMGKSNRSGLRGVEKIFKVRFSKASGAQVEGVALGIAGDTAPNVLWRLLHGEMPDHFTPKVWWVSLGNNDLGRMECSEEVVVLGILRVVEEILERRPNAHVVINSIFPMTQGRGGAYPVISDYRESLLNINANNNRVLRSEWSEKVERSRHKMTDAELAEAAERDEQARDKMAARKKKYYARKRHKRVNPVMEDHKKMRKYELGGATIVRKSQKPLWTSIRSINKELRKFADKHDRVTFFDATNIFVKKRDKAYTLLTNLISIRGHPTEDGFALWEDEMVQKLVQILDRMKHDQPDLVKAPVVEVNEQDGIPKSNGDDFRGSLDDDMDDAVFLPHDDGFGLMGVGSDDDESSPSTDPDAAATKDDSDDDAGLVADNKVPVQDKDDGRGDNRKAEVVKKTDDEERQRKRVADDENSR